MQPTVLLVENTGLLETWDERDEEAATNQWGLIKYKCPCTWCCGGGMLVLRYVHNKMKFQIIWTSLHSPAPYSPRVNSLPSKNHVFKICDINTWVQFSVLDCALFSNVFSLKM
jgi:hypothetical protein